MAHRKIRRYEIRPIDIELRKQVEIYQIVNAASITALQELFVECAVFAEVLTEIKEDALSIVFKVELIPSNTISSIIDSKRYRLNPSNLPNEAKDISETI